MSWAIYPNRGARQANDDLTALRDHEVAAHSSRVGVHLITRSPSPD